MEEARLRIAVTGSRLFGCRLSDAQLARMRAAAPQADFVIHTDPGRFVAGLAEADIAAGQILDAPLPELSRLAWFHSWSAGTDGEPVGALSAAGVEVTSSKGNGAPGIAEYVMLAMMMLSRRAALWLDAQKRHAWERRVTPELQGAVLGLIGFGHIGQAIARRAEGFGMRVIAIRRDAAAPVPEGLACEIRQPDDLLEMLRIADYVAVAAPLTPQTRSLLRDEHFRAMKASAFYICVSRGAIAEEAALCRALREGWIAGAALDAHATEPLPPDSPLWDLPNTIVTPHNAGATQGNLDRAVDIFIDNLKRTAGGQPRRNVVDPAAGY